MYTFGPDSRFASPTASLDPRILLHRVRKIFWLSLGLALALHLAIVGLNPFQQAAQKAPQPLSATFIKREPRLRETLDRLERGDGRVASSAPGRDVLDYLRAGMAVCPLGR